jgi:hypothetical protein
LNKRALAESFDQQDFASQTDVVDVGNVFREPTSKHADFFDAYDKNAAHSHYLKRTNSNNHDTHPLTWFVLLSCLSRCNRKDSSYRYSLCLISI